MSSISIFTYILHKLVLTKKHSLWTIMLLTFLLLLCSPNLHNITSYCDRKLLCITTTCYVRTTHIFSNHFNIVQLFLIIIRYSDQSYHIKSANQNKNIDNNANISRIPATAPCDCAWQLAPGARHTARAW